MLTRSHQCCEFYRLSMYDYDSILPFIVTKSSFLSAKANYTTQFNLMPFTSNYDTLVVASNTKREQLATRFKYNSLGIIAYLRA